MKILSLTEDQFRLLKNQYEDELELALKYVEDIKSILLKLNKQEGKIVKERKPGKRRKSKKAANLKSGAGTAEPLKKSTRGRKKRGRKPKAVVAKTTPEIKAGKTKSKPGRKRGRKPRTAAKPVVSKKPISAVKAKPGRKKGTIVKKITESKTPVKTYISPEVKKEEL